MNQIMHRPTIIELRLQHRLFTPAIEYVPIQSILYSLLCDWIPSMILSCNASLIRLLQSSCPFTSFAPCASLTSAHMTFPLSAHFLTKPVTDFDTAVAFGLRYLNYHKPQIGLIAHLPHNSPWGWLQQLVFTTQPIVFFRQTYYVFAAAVLSINWRLSWPHFLKYDLH